MAKTGISRRMELAGGNKELEKFRKMGRVCFVGWLLNVPATC